MNTPESLDWGSHAHRETFSDVAAYATTTTTSSRTGRRRRVATIGARCGAQKQVTEGGDRAPGKETDDGSLSGCKSLTLSSGMPKLKKFELNEKSGSDSSKRRSGRSNVSTVEERIQRSGGRQRTLMVEDQPSQSDERVAASRTKKRRGDENTESMTTNDTVTGNVDIEIERLTDEIRRLELRLTDQVPQPIQQDKTERRSGKPSLSLVERSRRSGEKDRLSDESYGEEFSDDSRSKSQRKKRRSGYDDDAKETTEKRTAARRIGIVQR